MRNAECGMRNAECGILTADSIDCGSLSARSASAIRDPQYEDSEMAIVFKGRVFAVDVTKKRYPNGKEHEVAIVRHPPVVVVIPMEDDGRIVLIRQYRAAIDREMWEVPAGSVDPGESAEAAAHRGCE